MAAFLSIVVVRETQRARRRSIARPWRDLSPAGPCGLAAQPAACFGRSRTAPEDAMIRILILAAILLGVADAARAQDVQGVELCTRETSMDRRTSCLQSNIGYLQSVIAKNAAEARQKLAAAAGEIGALKGDVAALKAALATVQARLDKLEAAAKPPTKPDVKPEAKPEAKPDAKSD